MNKKHKQIANRHKETKTPQTKTTLKTNLQKTATATTTTTINLRMATITGTMASISRSPQERRSENGSRISWVFSDVVWDWDVIDLCTFNCYWVFYWGIGVFRGGVGLCWIFRRFSLYIEDIYMNNNYSSR